MLAAKSSLRNANHYTDFKIVGVLFIIYVIFSFVTQTNRFKVKCSTEHLCFRHLNVIYSLRKVKALRSYKR
jgi:hypothetical protein